MATAQEPKTASELRQEMWAAHNRFSDLTAELIRLKESEPGSARHLQILDEHLAAKQEVDRLQARLSDPDLSKSNPQRSLLLWIVWFFLFFSVILTVAYSYIGYRLLEIIYGVIS